MNLQNIPSHNTDIRKMFVASDGYVLMSSDYSAQEPRLTAHLSQDEKMIAAYQAGKDVYCEIASLAYNVPYEECKESRPDGTKNPEGKERRGNAKKIVLGICYGRGIPSIAEQMGCTVKQAQEIYDKVLFCFPQLKQFMEDSERMAREQGYVTTVWGRKRRLPDMQLPLYEFTYAEGAIPQDFDPLSDDVEEYSNEVPYDLVVEYTNRLVKCRGYKEKERVKADIRAKGIDIKDNGGYIAQATRQCVNARIQGSAADQTKKAMILLYNHKELRELGFRMLIPVHDEIIAECPEENAERCAQLMSELMVEAAKDLCVPSKCDVEIFRCWYGEPLDAKTLLPLGD